MALLLLLPALGAQQAEGESFLPFLFVAFAITWIAFFVYAFFINRKQADLQREIEMLRALQTTTPTPRSADSPFRSP